MSKRIESGLRGPTLVLEDGIRQRMVWDDVEIHCYRDYYGDLRVDVVVPEGFPPVGVQVVD